MIEELRQLLDMVSKLPEVTLWVAGGFGLYKLTTFLATSGSIVFIAKLFIEKGHDLLSKPKPVSMEDIFITQGGTYDLFKNVLLECRGSGRMYLHDRDVIWIAEAIREKKQRDRASPGTTQSG